MPTISQAEFENLLEDIKQRKSQLPANTAFPLAAYLQEKGYSPILKDLNFEIDGKTVSRLKLSRADGSLSSVTTVPRRTDLLCNIDFTGCEINNCQFNECDLSGSVWTKIDIRDCNFNNSVLNNVQMHEVRFIGGCFIGSSLDYSTLDRVKFSQSILKQASFNALNQLYHLGFKNCSIDKVSMLGGASADQVLIEASSDITDFLTDKKITYKDSQSKKTAPVILGVWNNQVPLMSANLAEKMLMERGLNPVRMDQMVEVDPLALDGEINRLNELTHQRMQELKDKLFNKIKDKHSESKARELFEEEWKKQEVSFPLLMIEIMREQHQEDPTTFPQMSALYQHAKTFFDKVDGILLTGGQDMDPRFYGQSPHPKTGLPKYTKQPTLSDPRRDIFEFFLVYMQQRSSAPKPLCGICRGSQVIAASYGATIYQELDSPERRQYFIEKVVPRDPTEADPLYSTARTLVSKDDKELLAFFMHHQGYDLGSAHVVKATASTQTSKGPKIVVVFEGDRNLTAVQAHLEYYMDKDEKGEGFAPHMNKAAADSVFEQFKTRVMAYYNSQKLSTTGSGFYADSKAEPKRKEKPEQPSP